MGTIIAVFLISFILGFGVEYYGFKDDIKKAKDLEELKIKYDVKDDESERKNKNG